MATNFLPDSFRHQLPLNMGIGARFTLSFRGRSTTIVICNYSGKLDCSQSVLGRPLIRETSA
jgi:hypothetical protein